MNRYKGKKILNKTLAGVLSLMMCIALTPIKANAVGSYSGSAGGAVNGAGGNAGSWNYCSSPAYALYLAEDDWYKNAELGNGMNDESLVAMALRSAVEKTFEYKYPSWGTNYIYLVPTFEPNSGGTGHASEMSAINRMLETNSSYSGWYSKQDSERIVKITAPYAIKPEIVKNTEIFNRGYVCSALVKYKGQIPFKALEDFYTKDIAYKIFQYIVTGGPNQIASRASDIAYNSEGINWGQLEGTAEKMYWQQAGYLALMMSCYHYAGSNKAAWKAKIENMLDTMNGGSSSEVKGFPILVMDRALGVSTNNGAMNAVIDGIDFYSYATGMTSGKWNNLRDGYDGAAGFANMAYKILSWLDSSKPGRAIPIKAGYNSAGGIGPTMSLLGFNGYSPDTCSTISTAERYGLWAKLKVGDHVGYNYVFAGCIIGNPDAKGRQDIETDDPKKVTLPKGSTTIGQDIPIHFEIDLAHHEEEYKEALEKIKDIDSYCKNTLHASDTRWQLAMNVRREVTPEGNGGINKIIDEDGSTLEPQNNAYRNLAKEEINNLATRDTEAWAVPFSTMLQMLENGATWEFMDKTTDDPIISKRHYDYYSTAYLRCMYQKPGTSDYVAFKQADMTAGTGTGQNNADTTMAVDEEGWMKLKEDDGYTWKEFVVNDNKYHYDSEPVGLSEVKQGEPMNEKWEAMSGTVTTAPLYFASGGSEFAVTIDCTPREGYVNRKYSVSFPSWKDEHYGTTGPCKNCNAHPGYYDSDDDWHPPVYCHCSLGSATEDWTQSVKYSYMQINTVKVWRVKESAVTGMKELTPMNSSPYESDEYPGQLVTQIVEGDEPGEELYVSIFTDTSTEENGSQGTGSLAGGRLRFTEMPENGGSVSYDVANNAGSGEWGEGPGACSEKDNIPPRREADVATLQSRSNDIYVQSDYVILHTKEGDMVLNYSETTAHTDNLVDTLDATKSPEELWDNNQLSPAKWQPHEINQFWYNGDFANPDSCFTPIISPFTFKSSMIDPIDMEYREQEDSYPKSKAGKLSGSGLGPHDISAPSGDDFNEYPMAVRWEKAYPKLASNHKNYDHEGEECEAHDATGELKMWRQFNPLLTHENGTYDIGNSSLLYERILSYYNPQTGEVTSPLDKVGAGKTTYSNRYSDSDVRFDNEADYADDDGKNYLVVHSGYSEDISDCNDIVIHNPVSAEKSYVLTLPEDRDQRIDRSKTLAAGSISAMTDAQDEELKITNPDYHNNLVFNGFVESEKKEGQTLGWKTGIGSALGWEMMTENNQPDNKTKAYFGCDVDKGIIIENNGYGTVSYYQDIPATAGHNYTLSYNVEALEGTHKATVQLKYLDSKGDYTTNDKATKIRVLITQAEVGKSLVNEIVVKNMSKAGFIPVSTTFYDINYSYYQIEDKDAKYLNVDSPYHYIYKDKENGNTVDSLTKPADEVLGSALSPIDSSTVDDNRTYVFMAYYYCYKSGKTDEIQDGLIKMRGLHSGEDVQGEGANINQVVGKVYQYRGQADLFAAPEEGNYYFEAYGGDGGANPYAEGGSTQGGKGTYTSGIIHLNKGDLVTIKVGGKGQDSKVKIDEDTNLKYKTVDGKQYVDITNGTTTKTFEANELVQEGAYNGGGRVGLGAGGGGGATTISKYRAGEEATLTPIIIAGGGGGAGRLDGKAATIGSNALADEKDRLGRCPLATLPIHYTGALEVFNVNLKDWEKLILGSGGGGATGGNCEFYEEKSRHGYEDDREIIQTPAEGGTCYESDEVLKDRIASIPRAAKSPDGNGKVVISYMKYFGDRSTSEETDLGKATVRTIAAHQYNNNPPTDAFITKIKKADTSVPTVVDDENGITKLDTFINLDYGFSVYFPNEGDFKEDSSLHGIADVTRTKGMGYKDNMDTTEWTYAKYVQFPFNVMHNGERYAADEKIYLDVNKEYFDFYCVLGNNEASAAKVNFVALAINNPDVNLKGSEDLPNLYSEGKVLEGGTNVEKAKHPPEAEQYKTPMDNASDSEYILYGKDRHGHNGHYQEGNTHTGVCLFDEGSQTVAQDDDDCYSYKQYIEGEAGSENNKPSNFKRNGDSYRAKHSAMEVDLIDIVGRIGNYIIDDVGDPTFANFFKKADGTGNYIVPGLIPTVDSNKQNNIVGDIIDIRKIDTNSFSGTPSYNSGNSKNTLSNSNRGSDYYDKWTNTQGEPQRPGDGYGDSDDPKGQTSYNQSEVLGNSNDNHNAFLNTWGRKASPSSPMEGWHDTEFGQMAYKVNATDKTSLPLTNTMNNIPELRTKNLKLGYPVFQDIQTIGDYYGGTVQVSPTYYALDLDSDPESPILIPVDIYMAVNNSYVPINIFGASQVETEKTTLPSGTTIKGKSVSTVTNDPALNNTPVKDASGNVLKDTYGNELKYRYIFDNKQFIDWDNENVRRNSNIGVSQTKSAEQWQEYAEISTVLDDGTSLFKEQVNTTIDGKPSASHEWKVSKEMDGMNYLGLPFGMYYATGNNQILNLNQRCRTYVGGNFTYGSEINKILSGSLDSTENHTSNWDTHLFMQEAQRWHFTNYLPSSAVAVKAGDKCNSINIADLRKDNYVLLTALDIKALGSIWTLQYAEGGENDKVTITKPDGDTERYDITDITKGKVVTVTSINKSARDDRTVVGTH